jgi:hypothetical protein
MNTTQLAQHIKDALTFFATPPKVEVKLNDDGVEAIYIADGGIEVVPETREVEVKSIAGTRKVKKEGFCVYRSVLIPGVHTFRNGDPGYPDAWDVEEVDFIPTVQPFPTIEVVLKEWMRNYLQGLDENLAMAPRDIDYDGPG